MSHRRPHVWSQILVGGARILVSFCVLRLGAGFGAIPGAESAIWGGRCGFRDRRTGCSLNQIEIDELERLWRQNWSVFACSVWGQVLGPLQEQNPRLGGVGLGFGTDGRVVL